MAARYGRRLRRGVAGTAVAAAAMAALTASQAPGMLTGAHHRTSNDLPPGTPIDGGSPYITALPPLNSPTKPGAPGAAAGTPVTGDVGLPATVLAAYRNAESTLRASDPGCHLPWELLAAIGQVESGQADGGAVDAHGNTLKPILGPVLDGSDGYARIIDTDGSGYARATGPMQFIPSTWTAWGADGNADGIKDPNNVFDAALAAGDYLCAAGGDLSAAGNMRRAILGYNHSQDYLNTVLSWYAYFRAHGAAAVPGSGGAPSAGGGAPGAGPSTPASPRASRPAAGGGRSAAPARPPRTSRPTVSASGTVGPAPGGSPSSPPSASPSLTGCPTSSSPASPSPSPSASSSASGSPSATPSPSSSASPSPSASATPTPSGSPSASPSGTVCPSPSGTAG